MATVTTPKKTPPSPPQGLIGGHLLKLTDPVTFYMDNMRQYGDIVRLNFNGFTSYQVNHPDLIQQVLVQKASSFHKSPIYKRLLSVYLGDGLLISDGEFWKRQRKLAQPAFHTRRINAYAETMVDYSQQMLDEWQPGQQRDIAQEMMRLTLWIVGKTLFDADLSQSSGQVAEALEFLLDDIPSTAKQIIRLPRWIPTPTRNRRQQVIETLEGVMNPIIEERRRTGEDHGDLLSMLLLAQDDEGQGMTDQQVRDEALTLVLAGHETTANALTWTLYLLSQNPQAEQKLLEEVDAVLGGNPPTLDDLGKLQYTEMVLKEGMRLYPPAWSFGRQAIEDVRIGDYWIPERSGVMIVSYVVHRHPDYWDRPEQFQPERFTPEAEHARHKYAYFPFGGGSRICIGNAFAMMEARLILASIMQRYRLRLVPGHVVEPEPLITMRPRYGMQMMLEARG